jgi:hypothetical protein
MVITKVSEPLLSLRELNLIVKAKGLIEIAKKKRKMSVRADDDVSTRTRSSRP